MIKIISLIFISLLLILVWFKDGLILGGGEAGIPFYNLANELSIVNHAWVAKALGNPTGIVTALSPYFYFFSLLQVLGIPSFVLQAGLFFVLLAIGGLGMYFLVRSFSKHDGIAFASALFYSLNLFAMAIVWSRFQYPFMFFYSLMPLALLLFTKGLGTRKLIFAVLLNLLLFFFIMAFASFPLLLLFWLTLGLYLLFFIITNFSDKKKVLGGIVYFLGSLVIFLIFNLWWIVQFFQTFIASNYVTQQAYATSESYITFTILSNNLGNLDHLLRLMHRDFFLWMREVWGNIYQNPFMVFLSFLPLVFIFGSMFIKKKPREYFFFLFLAIVSIFFAKGSNDPFGGIFYFLFTHFKLLEAFRNPFEKIGLLIPLAYAPLFGFGVWYFYNYLKSKKNKLAKVITGCIVVLICGVLVWPMWNGWVFSSNEPPANNLKIKDYVKVPSYYTDANNWLNQQTQDFRTIALPLKGEGLTHTWEYGYNGVDLSSSLFDKPFLAFCTGLEYLCPITSKFQESLMSHPDAFWKNLPPLNAKYIMVREDLDYRLRSMLDPADIKKQLEKTDAFNLEKQFGKLSFYRLKDEYFQPKIFGNTDVIFYHNLDNESFVEVSPYADYKTGDIYLTDNVNNPMILNQSKQVVLKADIFEGSVAASSENAELELPYVRFLPGSFFYKWTRLKEDVTRFLAGNDNNREVCIEADKRIVEVKKLLQKNQFSLAKQTALEYQKYLEKFLANPGSLSTKENTKDILIHKYILRDILAYAKNTEKDEETYIKTNQMLHDLLYKLELESQYPVDLSRYASYRIFVPEEGKYQLIIETKLWPNFYEDRMLGLLIDGKNQPDIQIEAQSDSQILEVDFAKGFHQIDIKRPVPKNLVNVEREEYIIETSDREKRISLPFLTFDPLTTYDLSFMYYVYRGSAPRVFVRHDTDRVKNGKVIPYKAIDIEDDLYNRDWRQVNDFAIYDLNAHTSELVFEASPWNNCLDVNPGFLKERCENEGFKKGYNKESKVAIKDISVTKRFDNNLFLVKEKQPSPVLSAPEVTYTKINSARYMADIRGAKNPFILTFLETFHPSWKAYIIDKSGNRRQIEEKHHVLINSFANGWLVNKQGDYKVIIEFLPEKYLSWGKIISFGSVAGSCLFLIMVILKKKKYGNN